MQRSPLAVQVRCSLLALALCTPPLCSSSPGEKRVCFTIGGLLRVQLLNWRDVMTGNNAFHT